MKKLPFQPKTLLLTLLGVALLTGALWRGSKPTVQTPAPSATAVQPVVAASPALLIETAVETAAAQRLQQRQTTLSAARSRVATAEKTYYDTQHNQALPVQSGAGDLPARVRRTCAKFAELGIHCAEPADANTSPYEELKPDGMPIIAYVNGDPVYGTGRLCQRVRPRGG